MGAPALDRCPLMPTYGPPSVQFVRGDGVWLWDREGRRYLDLLSGLAVTSLGHSHPAVVFFLTTPRLSQTVPLNSCISCETTLRIARA